MQITIMLTTAQFVNKQTLLRVINRLPQMLYDAIKELFEKIQNGQIINIENMALTAPQHLNVYAAMNPDQRGILNDTLAKDGLQLVENGDKTRLEIKIRLDDVVPNSSSSAASPASAPSSSAPSPSSPSKPTPSSNDVKNDVESPTADELEVIRSEIRHYIACGSCHLSDSNIKKFPKTCIHEMIERFRAELALAKQK